MCAIQLSGDVIGHLSNCTKFALTCTNLHQTALSHDVIGYEDL